MELKRLKIFFIFMTAYSIVFNILHGLIYKTVQERISDQAFLFNIFEGIYLLISLIPILIIIKILFKNIINDDVLNTVIYILFLQYPICTRSDYDNHHNENYKDLHMLSFFKYSFLYLPIIIYNTVCVS
jgi:hypothetical protein